MRGLKPWHIILIVIAFVALPLSLVMQAGSAKVDLADTITLVDVSSGELFQAALPKDKAVMFPAVNPITKNAALFPAFQRDGKWFMEVRHVGMIKDSAKINPSALADPKTGELRVSGETPKVMDVF